MLDTYVNRNAWVEGIRRGKKEWEDKEMGREEERIGRGKSREK